MSKHLSKGCLYQMPSGAQVHPCRLIVRDGTLMWKHALLNGNQFTALPEDPAHEQHIIKTAQRVEELNVWVSQDLNPWECIMPIAWYDPSIKGLNEGISLFFRHGSYKPEELHERLIEHIQPHETLSLFRCKAPREDLLLFKRC